MNWIEWKKERSLLLLLLLHPVVWMTVGASRIMGQSLFSIPLCPQPSEGLITLVFSLIPSLFSCNIYSSWLFQLVGNSPIFISVTFLNNRMSENISLSGDAVPYVQVRPPGETDSDLGCISETYDSSRNNLSMVMSNISNDWSYLVNTQPTHHLVPCNSLSGNVSELPLSSESFKYTSELSPAGDIIVAIYLLLLGEFTG